MDRLTVDRKAEMMTDMRVWLKAGMKVGQLIVTMDGWLGGYWVDAKESLLVVR